MFRISTPEQHGTSQIHVESPAERVLSGCCRTINRDVAMRKVYTLSVPAIRQLVLLTLFAGVLPFSSWAGHSAEASRNLKKLATSSLVCEPIFSNVPANVTVQCDDVPAPAQNVSAVPQCCADPNVTITFSEEKKLGNICGDDYTLTRVWTATDACGNVGTATQIIKVIDTEPPVFVNPPGDISVECSAIPPAPIVMATDNCDQSVFLILIETQLPGPCFGTFNLSRLWVARDNCDNAASHVQIVTVKDTKPPVFTKLPADLTINCSGPIPAAVPGVDVMAADECNPNVMITVSEEEIPGSCPIFYELHRTFTANDGCGNKITAKQVITVLDDQPPVIANVPANVTVECNTPPPASPSATDNCDGQVDLSVEDIYLAGGGCGEDVVLQRTWTATDDCGNTSTAVQIVTVMIEGDIQFGPVPNDITVSCEAVPVAPAVTAFDACGLPLMVELTSSITNGSCPQSYSILRTWTAKDPCGNTATRTQTVTVLDNTPPVISAMLMDVTVSCGNIPDPAMVNATDLCDPAPVVSFSESIQGQICDAQVITRTWNASDACGNSTQVIQKIYVQDDQPPVVINPPVDLTINCAQMPPAMPMLEIEDDCGDQNITVNFQEFQTGKICDDLSITRIWTIFDGCGNKQVVTQMIMITDDMPPVIEAPADITVDCEDVPDLEDAIISDDCDQNLDVQYQEMTIPGQCPVAATIMRTWTATDDCGNVTTKVQNVVVVDTEGPELGFVHPLLIGLQNGDTLKIACDNPPIFEVDDVTVSDNCDDNPSLTMEDILIMTGPCKILLKCIWTATDECGNVSTLCFYFLIGDDEPPMITGVPADLTLECDQPVPAPVVPTVTDNCTQNLIASFLEVKLPGSCIENYMLVRTWMAQDSCGNKTTKTQKITVQDTQPPVWMPMHPLLIGVNSGDTLHFECDNVTILEEDDLVAKDNCDDNVDVTFEEMVYQGDCEQDGYYLFMHCVWTAVDDCGNATVFEIYAKVSDTQPPMLMPLPKDITISCDEMEPSVPMVKGEDNCTEDIVVDFEQTTIPGSCPQSYTIVRTWRAEDECGNEAVHTQYIYKVDNEAPVFTNIPANLTIECDDPIPSNQPVAEDNCDPQVTITYKEKEAAGPCTGTYLLIREWIATDDCGNSAVAVQQIYVEDTTPPVLIGVPNDVTVECDQVPAPANVKAVDACDPDAVLTFKEIRQDGNCPQSYTLIRTWTATDDCGNTTSDSQIITVRDTEAPILGAIPADLTLECSDPIPAPPVVTATDNCDNDVQVTLTPQIIPGNCEDSYTMIRTWTATDDCGNTATKSQTISVFDTTAPEFISVPDDLEIECDEIIPVQGVSAVDNCDDDVDITLNETTIPSQCPQEYILVRVWTAEDNCGNTATAEQVIKVTDNTPPVLFPIHPILIGVNSGDTLTFPCDDVVLLDEEDMGAEDNCDPNPVVTFHESEIKGDCDVDGFILQLTCTWTATDACGNSSSFQIIVRITDEVPPVLLNLPANVTIECDEDIPAGNVVTAEDNCDGPVNVTMSEQVKIGACKHAYAIVRTWTATDQCGNTTTASRTITVQDTTPPVFDQDPVDLTIECDEDLPDPLTITATDNCDTDPVITYKEAYQPGNCPQEYMLLRIWQAEDACGNSATITQKLTIVDTKAPLLIGVPADLTVECDNVPDPANVKAVDSCDPDVDVTFSEEREDGPCPQSYTLIRTWTAVDDCGNQTVDTQKITVEDTEPPVFTLLPEDITVACDQPLPDVIFDAEDNCSSNLDVQIVLEGGKACDNIPDRRIITVSDECGNQVQAIQNILLIDTVPPTFKPYVQKLEVQCDEIIDLAKPEAMDNCDDDVVVTLVEQKLPGACPQEYTLIRNWTATDDCGNTATIFQLIVVVDEVGPTLIPNDPLLVGLPNGSTLQFNCEDAPALDVNSFIAVDNCDPDPSITFEEEITSGDCATDGYFLQLICTWTATDACGNSSTFSVTIQITDTEAPVFVQVPADVTIGCTDDLPTDEAIAEDNCDNDLTLTSKDVTTDLDCGYLVTRTWTALDDCGNQATASQQIRVIDQDAPFLVTVVNDLTVDLDNGGVIPAPANVEADDECSDVEVTFAQTEAPGNDCGQIITRTWTATDACGNTAQLVQVITVLKACPCVLPEIDTVLVTHPDCGEKNGIITVVPVGNASSFEYTWLPNKGIPNADGNSHSGLDKGNYTILVNDPKALNCFTKVSIDLEPIGTCVDTIYVSIPQDDPYTICIEDVLDFDGNIISASVCGQDPDEVVAIVNDNSPCVILDPVDGFTGTSTLCVIHCNDEIPEVCDTTYIVVTITTLQQPCDTIFQNSLYGYELETCDGSVEVCIGIDPLQVSDYQILVNGKAYSGQILPCGANAVTILLKLGTWEIEVIHAPTQCSDGTSIQVTCPDEEQLIAVDDQAKTKKNQTIEIAVLNNDIVPSGETIEGFKIVSSPAHGAVSIKNNQTIVYSPEPDYCGDDQFAYEICISEEVCDQADVYVDVNCNLLVIHTGFSPNGDNINDNFTIDGIEDYPENELTVFNRWGLKIYHQRGYKNNWNGNWEDQILPDGTYFYVLKDGEGETYSGYVQIHR